MVSFVIFCSREWALSPRILLTASCFSWQILYHCVLCTCFAATVWMTRQGLAWWPSFEMVLDSFYLIRMWIYSTSKQLPKAIGRRVSKSHVDRWIDDRLTGARFLTFFDLVILMILISGSLDDTLYHLATLAEPAYCTIDVLLLLFTGKIAEIYFFWKKTWFHWTSQTCEVLKALRCPGS